MCPSGVSSTLTSVMPCCEGRRGGFTAWVTGVICAFNHNGRYKLCLITPYRAPHHRNMDVRVEISLPPLSILPTGSNNCTTIDATSIGMVRKSTQNSFQKKLHALQYLVNVNKHSLLIGEREICKAFFRFSSLVSVGS